MSGRRATAVLALLLLPAGLTRGGVDEPPREAPLTPGALRARIRAQMPDLLERHAVVGVAVAEVRDGRIAWADGFGLADADRGIRVSTDTVFNVGSISKTVTAWGALRLVEQGKLDLDAPVSSSLSRWTFPESEYDTDGVTVRRLLSHTAGLSMHSIPGFAEGVSRPRLEQLLSGDYRRSTYTAPGTPVEIVKEPGTGWSYSGGGYILLELLMEEASGESFPDHMRDAVLEPLEMSSSRFGWDGEQLAGITAVPYGRPGRAYDTFCFASTAGAGFYTTVLDMARFVAAGLPAGDDQPMGRGVLRPETVASMYEPVLLANGRPAFCGLGYFVPARAEGQVRRVHHGGSNFGWNALLLALPDLGHGLVILTNTDNAGALTQAVICSWGEALQVSLPGCG